MCVLSRFSHVQPCGPHQLKPTRLLCPWDSPGKNTVVGYHALLAGIFLTQALNPHLLCLLHWQVGSVPLVPPAAAVAKSLQSCPILCDPIDGSPADSPVPGILQARTPEWVALSFSNAWKWNETTTTTIDVQASEHAMWDSKLISLFLFSLILHSLLKIVGTPRGQIISFSSLLSSLFFPLWPQLNFYQGYISSSACTKDHFEVHMLPAIMSEVPICYQWVSVSWIPPYR